MTAAQLEACDGLSYLVSLDDGLPQTFNIESYIRIVKDKANSAQDHLRLAALDESLTSPARTSRPQILPAPKRHCSSWRIAGQIGPDGTRPDYR